MELGDIISDAIHYPLNHTKELLIYLAIYFVMALIALFTGIGLAGSASADNIAAAGIIGIIGIILILLISFLINGYGLDIIKFGIQREDEAPEIDIARQVINGIKYLIVNIVYMIIPLLVIIFFIAIDPTNTAVQMILIIIAIIIAIIFAFALLMGECRLAKTESLGDALNIPEAVKDIKKVGVLKILAITIIIAILGFVLLAIAGIFAQLGDIGSIISAILNAVVGAFMFFFSNRALGLMYSDAA